MRIKTRSRAVIALGLLAAATLLLSTQSIASGEGPRTSVSDRSAPASRPSVSGEDPTWLVPQSLDGTGHLTLHGPGLDGDRVTFSFHGRMARTGITRGSFAFRHHSPAEPGRPAWTTRGVGVVSCLEVTGKRALVTTIVRHESKPPGGIRGPHAFYLKITDARRDRVTFFQGPPSVLTAPPQQTFGCDDPDAVRWLPVEPNRERLDTGNWRLKGPAA